MQLARWEMSLAPLARSIGPLIFQVRVRLGVGIGAFSKASRELGRGMGEDVPSPGTDHPPSPHCLQTPRTVNIIANSSPKTGQTPFLGAALPASLCFLTTKTHLLAPPLPPRLLHTGGRRLGTRPGPGWGHGPVVILVPGAHRTIIVPPFRVGRLAKFCVLLGTTSFARPAIR